MQKEYRLETSTLVKDESSETIDEANISITNEGIECDIEKIKSWVKENLGDDFVNEYGLRIYELDTDEIVYSF